MESITLSDLAQRLRVCKTSLRGWEKKGFPEPVRTGREKVYYDAQRVIKLGQCFRDLAKAKDDEKEKLLTLIETLKNSLESPPEDIKAAIPRKVQRPHASIKSQKRALLVRSFLGRTGQSPSPDNGSHE
jgi:DNA-binding transcriptional MerR regulator